MRPKTQPGSFLRMRAFREAFLPTSHSSEGVRQLPCLEEASWKLICGAHDYQSAISEAGLGAR